MKLSERLFRLFGQLLLLFSLVGGWIGMDYNSFKTDTMNIAESRPMIVAPGSSLTQIAQGLKDSGIIDQPRYLSFMGRWNGQASQIQAGEYLLTPGMTPTHLLELLVGGEVVQYSLTLVEGWTFKQMLAAIHQHDKIVKILDVVKPDMLHAAVMMRLGADGNHPEGLFFPDTYHFPRGTTDIEFIRRAHMAMQKRLAQEWQQRDTGLPYKTAYEALIMASIVEKETAVPAERPDIAGVFVRRLEKRMRLQTDPTVIYGLGDGFDGNIRRRDLRADTPYNTYTRHGLPPTPIALPSGEAIHAALHPAAGETLYFVAKGDGSHQFSATLEQHLAAVRKYQLKK